MDSFDVIVLGTGASGLTAAVTAAGHGASVGLFEKGDEVGGTSARSGGMIWIPCNHQMEEFGLADSREDALTYLHSLSHGMILDELAEAFVDGGPQMLRWLEDNTPVTFGVVEGFPDYHPEHPGGKTGGGRSLECPLFAYGELGPWADKVVQGYQMGKHLVMNETTLGKGTTDHIEPAEARRREEGDLRGCGQALVGRLLKGCLDHGIEPHTGHRAVRLLVDDGRVVGVEFEVDDETRRIEARRGVVLATGGFDWDPELVRSFIRGPMERSVAVETNTGDGLKMAMRIGAALGNMREAWWVPIMDVNDDDGPPFPWLVNRERTPPALDHRQRRGAAVHERGGQLQRVRHRLPRDEHHDLRVLEPAGVAAVRPGVRDAVRAGRPIPRRGSGAVVDHCTRRRWPSWATSSACRPVRSTTRLPVGTPSAPMAMIPTSAGVRASTTAGGATPNARASMRPSDRSIPARSMRSRSTPARWAPRAGRAPPATAR